MLFPRSKSLREPPRVVVTGAGVVTPLGVGWRDNASGFREGRTTFGPVTLFDVSRQRVRIACEAGLPDTLPRTRLCRKLSGRLDRAAQMLLLAAIEAWTGSGWEPSDGLPMVLGTSSGGMAFGESYFRQAIETPACPRQQPTRAVYYQAQSQVRLVGEALGFEGPVTIIANACASGSSAIGLAWDMVRRGRAERVLAGGYDALSLLVFSGFDSLQALSPEICRPFDTGRDGLTLGEGAAVLTIESLESAHRRHAVILGEIIGYGGTLDPHHLTQPHPQGDAALRTMSLACDAARITPADVDYVNAHGTGTLLNDSSEAQAINLWAQDRVRTLPVSSTKAGIGHLLGAAGAVEAVVCLMALREQWLPPQTTGQDIDPLCRFPVVREPVAARVNVALSNSFGFGGANATLILRRWT